MIEQTASRGGRGTDVSCLSISNASITRAPYYEDSDVSLGGVATVHVPGMPGVSYAVKVDNPYRSNGNTGELTLDRTWITQGLRYLALTRIIAGLAAIFSIRVSPEVLERAIPGV